MRPASFVAWRCESSKYAGTVMTASETVSPRYSSAVFFIFFSTSAEICGGASFSPFTSIHASPFLAAMILYGTMSMSF